MSTPPKREEFGLGHIKEVTEEQSKFVQEAPPNEITATGNIVSDVSSSFGEETTPSLGEKTLIPDEALSARETPTNEATPPVDETDSREQTLSPVPMVTEEEEGRAELTISRSESEDRQVKMESSGSSFDIITGGEEEEEGEKGKRDKEEPFEKREEEEKERDKEIEDQQLPVEDGDERVNEDGKEGDKEAEDKEEEKGEEQEPQTIEKTESLEEEKEEKVETVDELQVHVHTEGEEGDQELNINGSTDKDIKQTETNEGTEDILSENKEKEEIERGVEEEGENIERRQSLESQDTCSSLPQSPPTLSDNNILLSSLEETHPSTGELDKPQPPDDITLDERSQPNDTPPDDVPHAHDELQPSLSLEFSDEEDDESGAVPLPPRVDLHRASHFICIADEEVSGT